MQLKKLLEQWDLTSLKINAGFLSMEWNPRDEDKTAAWEMYVELITRVATQRLVPDRGDERAALTSIYQLFALTREIVKRNGRHCINFARIAVVVLNQVVRPFTTKWHRELVDSKKISAARRRTFRGELASLQKELRKYTKLLADLAGVEDLTDIENA